MEISRVKSRASFGMLAFIILVLTVSQVCAHSTKGRIKVPLDKAVIDVDDVAYFAESFVYRQLYNDNTRETQNRFFIREFTGIDCKNGTAQVSFVVLDKKNNDIFNDTLDFKRDKNKIWYYHPPGSFQPIEIFTYVPKNSYYLKKYGLFISMAAVAVFFGLLMMFRFYKNMKTSLKDLDKNMEAADDETREARK